METTCDITGLKAKWSITNQDGTIMNVSSARLLMREINKRANTNLRELRLYEVMDKPSKDVSDALETAKISNIRCLKTNKSYY